MDFGSEQAEEGEKRASVDDSGRPAVEGRKKQGHLVSYTPQVISGPVSSMQEAFPGHTRGLPTSELNMCCEMQSRLHFEAHFMRTLLCWI